MKRRAKGELICVRVSADDTWAREHAIRYRRGLEGYDPRSITVRVYPRRVKADGVATPVWIVIVRRKLGKAVAQ